MELLTPTEAAAMLKISRSNLKAWRKNGKLDGCYKVFTHKTIRYYKEKLEELILI